LIDQKGTLPIDSNQIRQRYRSKPTSNLMQAELNQLACRYATVASIGRDLRRLNPLFASEL
jgi:hypothetical protein